MVGMRVERGVASLKLRAVVTQALLALFLLVTGLVALATLLLAVQEFQGGYSAWLITTPAFVFYIVLTFVPAAIALTLWVWRAHANLHADQLDGLNYAPGWTAVSLWVPGFNLYAPKGAMRELWNRSHGEEPWFANQSVDAVNSWWTCYVVGILIVSLLTVMVLIDRFSFFVFLTPPGTNMLALAFASLLLAGSAWFLIRIVGRITKAQETVTSVGDTFA
ncbi:DUF4328 domain-containing protein [Novosphingobium sp.]|uniref:DUF4328 domain-containing protein n=1 Tax=Novosphingobium sp. TaxID=1874826 RepID=UPI0025FE195A|nr:DUF4328 domain-containing protein [Novosphingobium sp.]MCC6925334.1 DUF4328 domain-containing protein [Novosphingobium sp.]